MMAKLKGETFGPYYCSNCMMRQPDLRCTCFFCGDHFTNFEDRLIEEKLEKLRIHLKEGEHKNESNVSGND